MYSFSCTAEVVCLGRRGTSVYISCGAYPGTTLSGNVRAVWGVTEASALLELQSRSGGKPLLFQVVFPPNGTAALHRLNRVMSERIPYYRARQHTTWDAFQSRFHPKPGERTQRKVGGLGKTSSTYFHIDASPGVCTLPRCLEKQL